VSRESRVVRPRDGGTCVETRLRLRALLYNDMSELIMIPVIVDKSLSGCQQSPSSQLPAAQKKLLQPGCIEPRHMAARGAKGMQCSMAI
jgi:hypothetical protein